MFARVALLATLVACHSQGPPARLVVGFGDSVVINNSRPVQVSTQVFDARGHVLPNTGVRFAWASATSVSLTRGGVVTCTHAADATLRASFGDITKSVLVRCRPVHELFGGGGVNLVLGDPPYDIVFEAVDSARRRVRPLTAVLTVDDTTVVSREGWSIRARHAGSTGVDVWVGDAWAHWFVQVFEPAASFDSIRPGQYLVVPVRLAAGEQRSWQIPPSRRVFGVKMLPPIGGDTLHVPQLTVVGANCLQESPGFATQPLGYSCMAWQGAVVIAFHPRNVDPAREWRGLVAVTREHQPEDTSSPTSQLQSSASTRHRR
jgi:hypothetical protein